MAFFNRESNFGTAGVAKKTMSVGNIKHNKDCPGDTLNNKHTDDDGVGWCKYGSWENSIRHWYELISGEAYVKDGKDTIETIIPKYAPSSENDVDEYIKNVRSFVEKNRKLQ